MYHVCFECENFELQNSIAFCKRRQFTPTSVFYAFPHLFIRVCKYYKKAGNRTSLLPFEIQFDYALKKLKQFRDVLKDIREVKIK